MPTLEYTVEDQLVADLVALWADTPPTGLPEGTGVVHFRNTGTLPIPAVIIGHEGFDREKMKGMDGTGRVALRIAYRTDCDVTSEPDHRATAAIIDRAAAALLADDLALTYIHAVLRESPLSQIEDRRQITVLRYQVIATRCEPEEEEEAP